MKVEEIYLFKWYKLAFRDIRFAYDSILIALNNLQFMYFFFETHVGVF